MNRNITAAVLIILAIGIYFTVTESILAQAGKVQTVNAQYLSAIDTTKKTLQLQDQIIATYNGLSADDKDRISKMIPSSVDNIRLIIDLNNVASRHGLNLQGITAVAATPANGQIGTPPSSLTNTPRVTSPGGLLTQQIPVPTLDYVDVSFNVTAPYIQFISFLQDLEANLRIMDVTHLSMVASDTGVYTFQVALRTYWLRQQ